ncbi:MAG: methyltransferase [Clostridia bacterium]|nr:methyltransferase [Clostridia bacterium]
MEQTDDLILGGFKLCQQGNLFRFGTDAVLLYHITPSPAGRTVDLCSGNGAVAMLLLAGGKCERITTLELQAEGCRLCRKSAAINGVSEQITVCCGDVRKIKDILSDGQTDTVTVNPPYFKKGSGLLPSKLPIAIARHELECTIDDVLEAAVYLLREGGTFCMVHRRSRQNEILRKIKKYGLCAVEITTVFSTPGTPTELFLLRAVKTNEQLSCKANTFTLQKPDGSHSDAYQAIYKGE